MKIRRFELYPLCSPGFASDGKYTNEMMRGEIAERVGPFIHLAEAVIEALERKKA